jgi:hypothetical protein
MALWCRRNWSAQGGADGEESDMRNDTVKKNVF